MDTPDPPTPQDSRSRVDSTSEEVGDAPGGPEAPDDGRGVKWRSLLGWPPPGLGRIQGDLWQIVRQAGLGAVLLVLPLLWATTSEQEFWSLGPFGASWWVVLLTSALGLLVLAGAFVALFRLFRRAGRATDRGYGWITVALVAADARRDMGFLLQGGRAYSVLEPDERRTLLLSRLYSGAAYLLAVFWLPLGFAAGVLLAARGALSPTALSLFTLAPAALLVLAGGVLRMRDARTVRRTRRAWFEQPWSQDLARDDVGAWNEAFRERREAPVPDTGDAGWGRKFRLGAGLVLAVAVLVFLPFLTLSFTAGVGPLVASLSVPNFSATQHRAASAEAYRQFVLPADSSITPQRAGEILHTLTFAGLDRQPLKLERPPPTTYDRPWIPDLRGGPTGVFPARWSEELVARAADGLSSEEIEFLRDVADHPALAAFSELARAPALDVGSARWSLPFPEGTTMLDLPIPKMSAVRQASWAVIGSAALAAAEGRTNDAERILRELISVGFLMADDAPTVIDNLTGLLLVEKGGEALESLYAVSGRTREAELLRSTRGSAERTSEVARVGIGSGLESALRQMPVVVEDPSAIRGLRWEYFTLTNTLAPCLNTHKMVFGPGGDYGRWVRSARDGLVRWPSEEALFELARHGLFVGRAEGPGGGALSALLSLTLGGRDVSGSCASVLGAVRGLDGLL